MEADGSKSIAGGGRTSLSPCRVLGSTIDDQTRCIHYHTSLDIVAIKFPCCGEYYACYSCHQEIAHHPAQVWRKTEQQQRAVLCGACHCELTIEEYLTSSHKCPFCHADFNPGCSLHHPFYFES